VFPEVQEQYIWRPVHPAHAKEPAMTNTNKPKPFIGDPGEKTDRAPYPQSKEPWKQNAQKTTDPSLPDTPKPDLEKWKDTNTH
jgi:hypothetical protein